jgi:hypothetical protein
LNTNHTKLNNKRTTNTTPQQEKAAFSSCRQLYRNPFGLLRGNWNQFYRFHQQQACFFPDLESVSSIGST